MKEKKAKENQGDDRQQVCRMLLGEWMMGEGDDWRVLIRAFIDGKWIGDFW